MAHCYTPKFALPFLQEITTPGFSLIFEIGSRIGQIDFSLSVNPELGFFFIRIFQKELNPQIFS